MSGQAYRAGVEPASTCGYLLITGNASATPDAQTIVGENNVAFTVTPSGGISWKRLDE